MEWKCPDGHFLAMDSCTSCQSACAPGQFLMTCPALTVKTAACEPCTAVPRIATFTASYAWECTDDLWSDGEAGHPRLQAECPLGQTREELHSDADGACVP